MKANFKLLSKGSTLEKYLQGVNPYLPISLPTPYKPLIGDGQSSTLSFTSNAISFSFFFSFFFFFFFFGGGVMMIGRYNIYRRYI